jgi:DNA-binding transcriptional LysR family regulator
MSRALTSVRQRFPDLEIRLAATSDEAGADEVRRGVFDMVILSRFRALRAPAGLGLRSWTLGSDPLRLCLPPDHRLSRAKEADIADLHEEPWIFAPGGALGQLTVALCATAVSSRFWPHETR